LPDFVEKAYGYHIYFWSNEGEPLEPLHFHVSHVPHQNATKIWILRDGTLKLENNNDDVPPKLLKKIMNLMALEESVETAKEKWLNHFGEISYHN
jgi:hypothetical protein